MEYLDNALQNLIHCIDQNRDSHEATARALDAILQTTDAIFLRSRIPDLSDWSIPTAVQFTMHIQLMKLNSGEPQDTINFADFLHLFYEDMEDWAEALRRSVRGGVKPEA